MERSYAAAELIQLPRLSAREVVVLVTEIETAVKEAKVALHLKTLPVPIQRAYTRMIAERDLLAAVLAPQAGEGDTQAKRKADRVVDTAWAALFAWLNGWCQLPAEKNPHLDEVTALRALVFGEGLAFTQLQYKIEWQESESRLAAITRDGHDKTIVKLGGKPFLEQLGEAQRAYGDALGVTKLVPAATEAEIQTRKLATQDAMRVFVTRASAHADPEEDGSEALAEKLLAPVIGWESRLPAAETTAAPPAEQDSPPAPAKDPAPTG